MKLFYVPNVCSLAPHIALREAGLPFELDRINLKAGKKTQSGGDYLAINPKGYIPALQLDDGEVLTEVQVMLLYIADLGAVTQLAPPVGTFARVRLTEGLAFIATELHKNFSPLYHPKAEDGFKAAWTESKVLPRLDHLAHSVNERPYLFGDSFTVADAYAFYVLRAWQHNLKQSLSRWKPLMTYYQSLEARPSVRAALEAEAAPV